MTIFNRLYKMHRIHFNLEQSANSSDCGNPAETGFIMWRSQLFITNETRPVAACSNGSVKCRLTARIEPPPPRSNCDNSSLAKNRTRFLPCLPTCERVMHQLEVAFGEVFASKHSSVVLLSEGCTAICGTGVHIPLSPINDPL